MSKKVKFATKIDDAVLRELRAFAAESKRAISDVVSEAVSEHLQSVRVRPAFRAAASQVISEHATLLKRLAK